MSENNAASSEQKSAEQITAERKESDRVRQRLRRQNQSEQKRERDRARHLHDNMTPEQINQHQSRNVHDKCRYVFS